MYISYVINLILHYTNLILMPQSQIKNCRRTASVVLEIRRNRTTSARLQLGWQLNILIIGRRPSKFRYFLKLNGRHPIFSRSRRSKTHRTSIVRSPDGTWTASNRIWRWQYDFSKTSDINGDRADTALEPSGARTGTARCKIIVRVKGDTSTVHVRARDGQSSVGRWPADLHALSIFFVKM